MRWVVTGMSGQLGRCLVEEIEGRPSEALAASFDHSQLDLSNAESMGALPSILKGLSADVLVNAAAFTAVDLCETEEETAMAVNCEGPRWLAHACCEAGVKLVHVSTDYVFDGREGRPYREEDPIGPRTAYGRSKAAGEHAVLEILPNALIVRTSWVFGPGKNFVAAIVRQAWLRVKGEVDGPLQVVADQYGCPTYAADLAQWILDVAALQFGDSRPIKESFGPTLHLCNSGTTTWFDFAREILDRTGHSELEVKKTRTEDLDLPAHRPAWSVLDCGLAETFGIRPRSWQEALLAYLESPAGLALRKGFE